MLVRRAAGRPDAAPARRLPGDRDAGLRRDHPHHRPEPRVARCGARGSAPSTEPAVAVGPLRRSARSTTTPTTDPRADADPARRVPALRRHREQPRRPGLEGHPRGRGRRRADGRADVPVQAVGLRHRRGDRRPRRRVLRRQDVTIYPERFDCASILFLAAVVLGGPGNMWGVIARRRSSSPTCPSASAFADYRATVLRRGADGPDDLPAAGPAAPPPAAGSCATPRTRPTSRASAARPGRSRVEGPYDD